MLKLTRSLGSLRTNPLYDGYSSQSTWVEFLGANISGNDTGIFDVWMHAVAQAPAMNHGWDTRRLLNSSRESCTYSGIDAEL